MNTDHVKIVKQGAKAIDAWRREHPEMRLDLEGADLREINLEGADLREINLEGADLQESNLPSSDLRGAKLWRADLRNVDFASANLQGAMLSQVRLGGSILDNANLRGASFFDANLARLSMESADLSGANLQYASLTESWVANANFDGADFIETLLADIDLSQARGLEGVVHTGPSIIDERTLRKSWPLPDVFLRGVGLSDQYIEYLPSLMGQAIEFYSCFISYSTKDDQFARRLHEGLQDNGVRCWFAPEDLRIGDKFRVRIDEAIRLHDKLLIILSEDSVNSTWVEDEVESALEKERKAKERGKDQTVLFPIRLDSAVMDTDAAWAASIRRTRHIGDFSAWKDHDAYQKSFERLLRDLKAGAKD